MAKNYSYLDVKEDLKKRIETDKYKKEEKIPSERKLSEEFMVSRNTVRKAIEELVLENYLVKEPGRGTFVSSEINSNSAKTKTGNIFFLRCFHNRLKNGNNASKIGDDIFYPQVVAGIDMIAAKNDYHCIFKYIYEDDIDQKLISEIKEKADGIICGELHSTKMLETITSINLPVVLISSSVINDQVDVVEIDNFTGAFNLTSHLIDLGHHNFALIGGSATSQPSKERKNGFFEALQQNQIEFDQKHAVTNGWDFEDGYQAALEILDFEQRPTAVFAASDLLAIGAISGFKDQGLAVPDDISVVGFDDIDMANQIKPALTTMRVRKVEIGKEAAKLLFNKFKGNERSYPVKITVPTRLMIRDSVKQL
ncbi:GntR family transcriptional regulator [Halanaerobium saccharolyticum]|uniref:GntR family transcriptional regulator n=1 Tax=Halanaerobium saccharolyticum TaxID=43595 RepID=A0A4R6LYT5_9FIRM|nr:GntR family transcriptional regulator [Halanaerobium saccharolyticum]TDO94041.1 GntR family transcriptional regulator [Halanaerobium saccharolyticum]